MSDLAVEAQKAMETLMSQVTAALTAEAEEACHRLLADAGATAEIKVTVTRLRMDFDSGPVPVSRDEKPALAPKLRARKKPAARRRGRPDGAVRIGVLKMLHETSGPVPPIEIRDELARRGVHTTMDNVHQQLRRLVQAGELVRVGRGRYQVP